ncbi:MAG: hypothetical protein A3J55_02015 [Candidatus Ryanbacteria bacterium RIFCSPHIGHO2_02_FULL_45_17b]|nr:MAG: hypothetical protein A3J55_02015 [Candidatus Ryanbacteria bacterium RIFCSPHIGHO2_02_FULL_45_17b]
MAFMRREEKIKVCFVLPEKAEDTATHFAHKAELMKELQNEVEFYTYAAMGTDLLRIVYARFRGVRIYYVQYSFKGALIAYVVTKVFGGRVFYWNCGMPWLYKRGWFEEQLFRFILRHMILVIATDGLANEYATRYGLDKKDIRVVPNYIRVSRMQNKSKEEARKELGLPQDKKIVLFLHHVSRRKGAHLLPEIIKEFSNQSAVLFVIVGEGPEKKEIESRIKNYQSGEKVRMEGMVAHNKTASYFMAADVYLMPSEEEGMPNALLEAMAAGVPFVASDVAAVREMTPPMTHEFVLPYGKTDMFGEKIKKLLGDEELRKRIATEEQEWVERYDVSTVASRYMALFRE